MDRKKELRYQAMEKAISLLGDDKLKNFVAELNADIEALDIDGPKVGARDPEKELAEFKTMNLTQKGDLLKKDAAKYHELDKLAKAKR